MNKPSGMFFEGFTSRSEIGRKLRKTRRWGMRIIRAPCPVCGVECGQERFLAAHHERKHARKAAA